MVDWIGIDKTSGSSGITKVTITASSYNELTERAATLTITAKNQFKNYVNITQKPEEVTTGLTVTPTELVFDSTGETLYITITSNAAWTWGVFPDWIGVQDAYVNGGKAGTTTVSIGAVKNSGTTKLTGILSVKTYNEEVKINCTQGAYVPPQIMESQTDSLDFTSGGGVNVFDVYTNGEWTVTSYPDWLTLSATGGTGSSTPKTEYVTVTCGENTGDTRVGSIVLKASDENGATKTIYVTQEAKSDEPYVTVNPTELRFTPDGETKTLTIESNTDWGITYPNWVKLYSGNTLVTGQIFSGNAVFNVVVEENDSLTDEKVGTILIESDTITTGVYVFQREYFGIKITPNTFSLTSDQNGGTFQVKSPSEWTASFQEQEVLSEGESSSADCYFLKCVIDEGVEVVSSIIQGTTINWEYFDTGIDKYVFSSGTYVLKIKQTEFLEIFADNLGVFAREIWNGDNVSAVTLYDFPYLTGVTLNEKTRSVNIRECPKIEVLKIPSGCETVSWDSSFFPILVVDGTGTNFNYNIPPTLIFYESSGLSITEKYPTRSFRKGTVGIVKYNGILYNNETDKGYCKFRSLDSNWTVSTDADWLVLDKASGTPEDTEICYTATGLNETNFYKQATITFTTDAGTTELKVYQDFSGFAPENTIYYLTQTGEKITATGSSVVSNVYENGVGTIVFSGTTYWPFYWKDDAIYVTALKLPENIYKVDDITNIVQGSALECINSEGISFYSNGFPSNTRIRGEIYCRTVESNSILACPYITKIISNSFYFNGFSLYTQIGYDEKSVDYNKYVDDTTVLFNRNISILSKEYLANGLYPCVAAKDSVKNTLKFLGYTVSIPYDDWSIDNADYEGLPIIIFNSKNTASTCNVANYLNPNGEIYKNISNDYINQSFNEAEVHYLSGIPSDGISLADTIVGNTNSCWHQVTGEIIGPIEVYIPDNIKSTVTTSFTNFRLKYLYLGSGVTNISTNTFIEDPEVLILKGATNIEENAFNSNTTLSSLTIGYSGGVVTWSTNGVKTDNIGLSVETVYVPYELESAYKQDSNWKKYNIIAYKLTKNGVAYAV